MGRPRLIATLQQAKLAFWRQVKKQPGKDACWLWVGDHFDNDGYGVVNGSLRRFFGTARTSRISLLLTKGLPKHKFACHTCDNPPCVRPKHLYSGTHRQNTDDAMIRSRYQVGAARYNALLTPKLIRKIRRLRNSKRLSYDHLASLFHMSQTTMRRVVQRKTWRHV